MKVKHVLASQKDKKPTINNSDLTVLIPADLQEIILFYRHDKNDPIIGIEYTRSRNGRTWYPSSNWNKNFLLPKIGEPVYFEIIGYSPIVQQTLFNESLN